MVEVIPVSEFLFLSFSQSKLGVYKKKKDDNIERIRLILSSTMLSFEVVEIQRS